MKLLRDAFRQGFPDETRLSPPIVPYWQYRHGLYESEGVILYNERVVVPPSLPQAFWKHYILHIKELQRWQIELVPLFFGPG